MVTSSLPTSRRAALASAILLASAGCASRGVPYRGELSRKWLPGKELSFW